MFKNEPFPARLELYWYSPQDTLPAICIFITASPRLPSSLQWLLSLDLLQWVNLDFNV